MAFTGTYRPDEPARSGGHPRRCGRIGWPGGQEVGDRARLRVDGRDVAPLVVADSYLGRLRGLLGRRGFDGALLLRRCSSVHAAGMVFVLDVAQLDDELRVIRTCRLRPFGLVAPRRGARHVLEAQAGAFASWGLRPGSVLSQP